MRKTDGIGSAEWIRGLRAQLGLTQSQLAERIGVTVVTISRWENGQSHPNRLALRALSALASGGLYPTEGVLATRRVGEESATYTVDTQEQPDFTADAEVVRLVVEAERLRLGHLFSPSFGIETALIDVLPHQYIAVYERMLGQPRLRMLLADDAGAGKTIMSGLYIREMLNRRLLRRALIVCPAGLVGNWKRELRTLFSLHLREVTGFDCRAENPFAGPGSDLVIVSVDTLAGELAFSRLAQEDTEPYELVVIDEAHKLSAFRNADGTYETTDRYKLAELLAGAEPLQESRQQRRLGWHAHHLLLLTATPHMGREFQYYALWRLLEPEALRTIDAFANLPDTFRQRHFIRRTKEEMVRLDGSRIFPPRESMTVTYDLTPAERTLYDDLTSYVRTYFNRARVLNRSAVRLAMSVLQRRAASSTWALVRSLERRAERLEEYIVELMSGALSESQFVSRQARSVARDIEEEKTSDEEATIDGEEERDVADDEAMRATTARNLAELQAELEQVRLVLAQARQVAATGEDSKFEKLREIIRDDRFHGERILVFTEHRDTLEFLLRQLEGMGYTDDVAYIHGGMNYQEREAQMDAFRKRCRFMVATDAAGEGINLQFCWIMVNYDIPWNPARIEQRFGRIHRYKQEHDPVVLINMVAANTREGRVLQTLLQKLQAIRRRPEIGDRVFDVIGQQFQGVSLSELIMRAVERDDESESVSEVEARLSDEKVRASEDADARLRTPADDVLSRLPALREQRERDQLRRLLPGYVRRFMEKSAPLLGVRIQGDLDGRFWLEGLPLPLALALDEATAGVDRLLTLHRPDGDDDVVFLRPGEPFFDRYRAYFCERFGREALRGAVFVDPYAEEPYLYHLALVSVLRRADETFADAFATPQTVDVRLAAIRQSLDGAIEACPVELPMTLQVAYGVSPVSLPSISRTTEALDFARRYIEEHVARPAAADVASRLWDAVPERTAFLRKGFDYQEAELLAARARLRASAMAGDPAARRQLEEVRRRQEALALQREAALAVLEREPGLIEPGPVTFLAHALVLPSRDSEERERHDREIERIAMQVARAYEESLGATVFDVSDPMRKVGFDLLSRRPDGEERCIEVKGRRAVGDVQLSENEWAKAANLRDRYWLYVVYDCAALNPRLLRVRDPFGSLLFKARGGVIIDEAAIFQAAEG